MTHPLLSLGEVVSELPTILGRHLFCWSVWYHCSKSCMQGMKDTSHLVINGEV